MQPGAASHQPPSFPPSWCGLWKDTEGKVMYIRQLHGRQYGVSFAPSIMAPFHPLPDVANELTRDLPALYLLDATGVMHLRIEAGMPGQNLRIHFIFGEGDRLRPAEDWDIVSGVIARPSIDAGLAPEGEESTAMSWALPLNNYWKMDEEADIFLASHTL